MSDANGAEDYEERVVLHLRFEPTDPLQVKGLNRPRRIRLRKVLKETLRAHGMRCERLAGPNGEQLWEPDDWMRGDGEGI